MSEWFSYDLVESYAPIRGVVHLGAHYAEEAVIYGRWGSNVLWVEAHPTYAKHMVANLRNFPGQIGVEACLGSEDGEEVTFYVTSDEVSSSVFEPAETLERHSLELAGTVTVKTKRFDTIWRSLGLDPENFNFLVLDTQGSELEVLKGMGDLVEMFDTIQAEYSTEELYRGGARLEELDEFLTGFTRVFPDEPIVHADALYVKKELVG